MDAESVQALVADERAVEKAWSRVTDWAAARYGRDASIESMLFLIGVHATGGDFDARLKKEKKQDLIMDGTHAALETLGVYRRTDRGWDRVHALPVLSEEHQERLLRIAIARYLDHTLGS